MTFTVSGIPMPNPARSISICLADGRSGALRAIPPRDHEAAVAAVQRLAPFARSGFTPENRAYYQQMVSARR